MAVNLGTLFWFLLLNFDLVQHISLINRFFISYENQPWQAYTLAKTLLTLAAATFFK